MTACPKLSPGLNDVARPKTAADHQTMDRPTKTAGSWKARPKMFVDPLAESDPTMTSAQMTFCLGLDCSSHSR